MRTVLDDDDDSPIVTEITHGNPVPLPGAAAHRLDYERIAQCIGRPRDARAEGKDSDRIRNSDDYSRQSHVTCPLARPTNEYVVQQCDYFYHRARRRPHV